MYIREINLLYCCWWYVWYVDIWCFVYEVIFFSYFNFVSEYWVGCIYGNVVRSDVSVKIYSVNCFYCDEVFCVIC